MMRIRRQLVLVSQLVSLEFLYNFDLSLGIVSIPILISIFFDSNSNAVAKVTDTRLGAMYWQILTNK